MKTKKKDSKKTGPAVTVRPANMLAEALHYKVLSDRKINLTSAKAYEFLEMPTFNGERPVNERHVQVLYNAWASGRFIWDHVMLALCDCDGKRYRINGQHTCWMRVNIEKEIDAQVREVLYKVDEESQMRAIYSTFDQNKTRTQGHIIKALTIGTPATTDLWSSAISKLGSGLKFWLYEKEAWQIAPSGVAALIEDKFPELFKLVGLYWQSHYDENMFLRRNAVTAALFATFDAAPTKAAEFWNPVNNGLGMTDKEDPRYQLRRWLEDHCQSLKGRQAGKSVVNAEETYRVCILAWNKWRKGEKAVGAFRMTDRRHQPK